MSCVWCNALTRCVFCDLRARVDCRNGDEKENTNRIRVDEATHIAHDMRHNNCAVRARVGGERRNEKKTKLERIELLFKQRDLP
jgi:hypothetical protein